MKEARAAGSDGKSVYVRFVTLVSDELTKAGDQTLAASLKDVMAKSSESKFPRTEFAWITHTFAREFYKDDIIRKRPA